MRRLWVMVLLLAALALPAAARAADPLGLACADQGDGIRLCQGKVKTFDGVPLDANLALPAGSSLPLVVLSHGYGGSKLGYADLKPWAAARLRGAGLQRARLRRVVRQRRVAPGRPGRLRRRAGCAWTTCATRRATSSSSRACSPTPAWSTARRSASPAARTAAACRSTSRSCATASCSRTGRLRAVDLARRAADADRRRGAVDPVERPRLRAGAQRAHARLRGHLADRRPRALRHRQAVLRRRASTPRARRAATTRRRASTPTPTSRAGSREINAGEPYGADERAIADELAAHHSALLPRPLARARADPDRQRLDRRPLPRRRGAALLQPHARAVPRRAAVADVPRLRPPARPEQGRRRRALRAARLRVDGPLRQGRRERAGAARASRR